MLEWRSYALGRVFFVEDMNDAEKGILGTALVSVILIFSLLISKKYEENYE